MRIEFINRDDGNGLNGPNYESTQRENHFSFNSLITKSFVGGIRNQNHQRYIS